MEKTLSLGAFEELSENEVMVTEGGGFIVGTIVVGVVLVGILGVGLYALGSAINDGRRKVAQDDANRSGEPVTVPLLGYNSPTYTAYPDPNYKSPFDY